MPRALVVTSRDRLLRGLVATLLGPDADVTAEPSLAGLLERRRDGALDLLVVDLATLSESDRRAWLQTRDAPPAAAVAAVVPTERPGLLRLAQRAGAEALLLDPFDLQECELALRRLLARHAPPPRATPSLDALATFLRGLSHRVLNPLGSVTGLLQLQLGDANATAEVKARSETMMREARRVVAVVHQLESFAQEARLQPRRCRLVDLLREVVDGWRRRTPPLAATLDVAESSLEVRVDRRRLDEALESLVRYAGRTDPMAGAEADVSGAVVVEARVHDGRAVVAVEGSAPVKLPSDPDLLFVPFQPEAGSRSPGDGALASAWGTLRAHAGSLVVEPTRTGGVRFVATLPAAPPRGAGEDVDEAAQSK
jgi:K+-sensing histidine kinase KdpD